MFSHFLDQKGCYLYQYDSHNNDKRDTQEAGNISRIRGQKVGGKWFVSEDSLKGFFSSTYKVQKRKKKD